MKVSLQEKTIRWSWININFLISVTVIDKKARTVLQEKCKLVL